MLDAQNRIKLWDVQTSFLGESVFYSSFGIHIANSSIDEENQTVHANLKTISFDGVPLWEKTLDFPATLSETLPYEKQILFSSNPHHLYICFCANGRKISRVSPVVTLAQTSRIVSLDSSGEIEWEHQIPEKENKWIHTIECNNSQLCIAGGITGQTEGVPKDVFLTSFSPKGKIMWNIYIEGDETEPYLFFEPDVDPGSFVLGGLHLQMTKDAIVLATSTQSKDIQIQNGTPFNLHLPVVSFKQPTKNHATVCYICSISKAIPFTARTQQPTPAKNRTILNRSPRFKPLTTLLPTGYTI